MKDAGGNEVVQSLWNRDSLSWPIEERIQKCGLDLKKWERQHFGSFIKQIADCRDELYRLQIGPQTNFSLQKQEI